jgi:hypothetical protein
MLEVQRERLILKLREKIAYKCIISVSRGILLIKLKLDTLHGIEEKMNVIVKLSNRELLSFSNFSLHINLVMRMKTPEN